MEESPSSAVSEELRAKLYEAARRAAEAVRYEGVGTVEFEPGFEPVLQAAKAKRPAKIWLAPLMVVAGDHAVNDMAGEAEDSWNSRLKAEGFCTECLLQGLGQIAGVRKLYCEHAQEAEGL